MDDEEVDDPDEDENEAEEDPKKKAKYHQLFGHFSYCVCKKGGPKKDPTQDDVAGHINKIASDVAVSDPKKAAKFKAYLNKLIKPFFKAVKLNCYCTRNKAVVR